MLLRQKFNLFKKLPLRTHKLFYSDSAYLKWIFHKSLYYKYGLYRDDLLEADTICTTPVVKEALRRLPEDLMDERNFRIVRAGYLSVKRIYLPEEQWTTYESDITEGRYLTEYIEEIERENKEKAMWEEED